MSEFQDTGDYRQGDEEEEGTTFQGFEEYTEQVVFLIDVSESMFSSFYVVEDPPGSETTRDVSPFDYSMDMVRQYLRSRIFRNASDETAVLFFGAANKTAMDRMEHTYTLLKLDVGSSERMLAASNFSVEDFREKVGSYTPKKHATEGKDVGGSGEEEVPHSEALRFGLWAAGQVLTNKKKAARRVFLFTDCENPVGASNKRQFYKTNVIARAKELKNANISVQVFPLTGATFDVRLFWEEFIEAVKEEGDAPDEYEYLKGEITQEACAAQLGSLVHLIQKKTCKRRTAASLRWRLTPKSWPLPSAGPSGSADEGKGLEIGVQVYNVVLPADAPPKVRVQATTNIVLSTQRMVIDPSTGAPLSNQDKMRSFQLPSGDKSRFPEIVLNEKEVKLLRQARGTGLQLLGFKPRQCLKEHHNLAHSHFLRPNEGDIKGSVTVFKALLDAMIRLDRVAICRYQAGALGTPSVVALLPQREVRDEFQVQIQPEGMHAIMLPFMDDLRLPEADDKVVAKVVTAKEDAIEKAAALMDLITFEKDKDGKVIFDTEQIANPILQRITDVIEAIALQEPVPAMADLDDDTSAAVEDMERLYHAEMEAFVEAAFGAAGCMDDDLKEKKEKKRKAPDEDQTQQYAARDWDAADLAKLTIQDIKVYLQFHDLKLTGNKSVLVERIQDHLSKRQKT